MSALVDYRKQVEQALQAGNATEHTHRPALKALVEAIARDLGMTVTATNEPKRVKCGAPDYIVTRGQTPLGYIEAKDVDVALNAIEKGEQMGRYLDSLGNLILTDYLEFRWYVGGEKRMTARLASSGRQGKLAVEPGGEAQVIELLSAFLHETVPTVATPKELAVRMAALAHLLRDSLTTAFDDEAETGVLHAQLASFREVLLHDLQAADFMDMYAQTICYGLFTARCNTPVAEQFDRWSSARFLPKTNPFLKRLFGMIAGPELDDEPFVWVVDNLADLLNRADIGAILENFGKRTRQQDPVVHFYETFLAAYDPKMREARGVYYTPEPVVSYIVRSVDHLLKTEFGLPDGLADTSKVTLPDAEGHPREMHKVQVLDPATGTGTFLHGVIDQIHQRLTEQGQAGMWNSYVSAHLLPRLFGFELLMAPYAVAHMKLGLQLAELGYDFHADERLRIYLTNTLEEPHDLRGSLPFAQWLAEEANAASEVKRDMPILVVLGNPPYSGHSANKGKWINGLLRGVDPIGKQTTNYFEVDGKPLGERNPKYLNDDYVKFIRFAQWRIEQTGYGILAFISNNGYLDNPTFRGMRQSLMKTFDDIYILDLHGSSKKKEVAPDGSKDENVFDIQQGVAVGIFVKRPLSNDVVNKTINHSSLWGSRSSKYSYLYEHYLGSSSWETITASKPFYLLSPQSIGLQSEYDQGISIIKVFHCTGEGFKTHRDSFAIGFDRNEIERRLDDMLSSTIADESLSSKYSLIDTKTWHLADARKKLQALNESSYNYIEECTYRPFDNRICILSPYVMDRPRMQTNTHLLCSNLAIATTRSVEIHRGFEHVFCVSKPMDHHAVSLKEANYLFPLYLYPDNKPKATLFDVDEPSEAPGGRRPNLAPAFIADCSAKLGMTFVPDGKGDRQATFGPEDVFAYMYAVFHAPTYRSRYAEFLKIDFPRLPLTRNPDLFRALCTLGDALVGLHLLERAPALITRFPVAGSNTVEKVRYSEPKGSDPGRVWINDTQYIDGVPPEVWAFHVGGYQVCEKWLKDRKGRTLSYDDLTHYQRVIAALAETIRLMAEIDEVIDAHGGWPIQ